MKRLSVEQRARRSATRLNKRNARKYPLFAEQFATTVDEQIERITRKDVEFALHWRSIMDADESLSERGLDAMDAVRSAVSAEKFDEIQTRYRRIYSGRIESGAGLADYWWQRAKEHNSAWAQRHCPNSHFHEMNYSKCPTCQKVLTR